MGVMQIGPTSSYITVEPSYDFEEIETLTREDIRTRGGALYTYIESETFIRFSLPESWVNSSQRSLVNSWWRTATDLEFIPDSDFPSSLHNVRIMGDEEPYQKFVQPYFQIFYDGELIIETI